MSELDSVLDEIKERAPVPQMLESMGRTLRQVGNGRWTCLCPAHEEKTPSCSVKPDRWYCFGCQKSGDVIDLVMLSRGMDFMEAVRELAEELRIPLPERDPQAAAAAKEARAVRLDLGQIIEEYALTCRQQITHERAAEYVQRRGLSADECELWYLGYAPAEHDLLAWARERGIELMKLVAAGLWRLPDDTTRPMEQGRARFRDRLMFPVWDARGMICGFSGRALREDKKIPKYLNSPDSQLFSKRTLLYGLDQCRAEMQRTRRVVLAEGQMDVIAFVRAGVPAVAGMGTAFTADHAAQLRKLVDAVDLAFDADAAGQAATEKTMAILLEHGFRRLRVVRFENGKDADEISKGA